MEKQQFSEYLNNNRFPFSIYHEYYSEVDSKIPLSLDNFNSHFNEWLRITGNSSNRIINDIIEYYKIKFDIKETRFPVHLLTKDNEVIKRLDDIQEAIS